VLWRNQAHSTLKKSKTKRWATVVYPFMLMWNVDWSNGFPKSLLTERDDTTSKFKCTNARFKHVKPTSNVVYGIPSSNGKFASPLPIHLNVVSKNSRRWFPTRLLNEFSASLQNCLFITSLKYKQPKAPPQLLNKVKLPSYRLTLNVSVPGWMDTPRAECTVSHLTSFAPATVTPTPVALSRSPTTASSSSRRTPSVPINDLESFLDGRIRLTIQCHLCLCHEIFF